MPGQPTCSDHGQTNTAVVCSCHEGVELSDTIQSPTGSLDSLLSEICDDPVSTLSIPDATISSPSPSPPPPTSDGVKNETDSGILHDQDPGEIVEASHAPTGYISSEYEEDISEQWCPTLYMLQTQTPKPMCVVCETKVEDIPLQYGAEYHGICSKEKSLKLLGFEDGSYLVRSTDRKHHILSLMLDRRMYNYKLFYEEEMHFVGEKRFEHLEELVEDGLITLYLQKHGVIQAMEEGRHNTLTRKATQKKLRRKHGKRVKGLKGKAAWDYQRSKSSSSVNSASHSPSPSPVVSPSPIPNREIQNLSLEPEPGLTSQSAPHTPTRKNTKLSQISNCEQSDLDFSSCLRLSTPNLSIVTSTPTHEDSCELESQGLIMNAATSSPLAQRRAKSTSSIQKDALLSKGGQNRKGTTRDKRYSAIFSTLRDVVKEDRIKNSMSMDVKHLKTYSSESKLPNQLSRSLAVEFGVVPRSHSCSSKAFTFSTGKIRDVSLHGTSTLNKSSLSALAKHTMGPNSVYYKAHKFEMHSYKSPTWCEVCHHFLWGLKQQGMRCQDCGMDIHKQCLPIAMQLECFPNKQFVKKVFGVDLTTIVKMEGGLIPNILSRCFAELQSRDLTVQGIYRISGQNSEIMDLKDKFNQGEIVNLSMYQDMNIITGVIKLYLRELPIPLITFDTYNEIMKATGIGDLDDCSTDWNLLSDTLKLLPKPHYNTLKHLAQHLHMVDLYSSDNKMSARNLAVVFAPTLMRAPSQDQSLVQDLPIQKYFIECIILKHDIIFR